MEMHIKQWFTCTHLDLFSSQIDFFLKGIQERMLPAFDDIESDAEAFEKREFERLSEVVHPEMMDEADLAEIVRDMAVDYYVSFRDVFQGMHNLLAVGIFHLFEQQVCSFNRAFQDPSRPSLSKIKGEGLKYFEGLMSALGADVKSLTGWSEIKELELIANASKHGDGRSARKLREVRPELFEIPRIGITPDPDVPLGHPLSGQGIFVQKTDLERYANAIKVFWNELSAWE
jgi:hypothetical protein